MEDDFGTPIRLMTSRTRIRRMSKEVSCNPSISVNDCYEATETSKSGDETKEDTEVPALQLEKLCLNLSRIYPELNFAMSKGNVCGKEDSYQPIIVVTQRKLFNHPPFGFTSRVQITIQENLYSVTIVMMKWESGGLATEHEVHNLCDKFSERSNYKFCPGINQDVYEEYYGVIRFDLKSVRKSATPFSRIDSVNCKLWFSLASNASARDKAASEVLCTACKRLLTDLEWQKKRTLSESPSRKVKRQAASSRARLTYMSPYSQQRRKQNFQTERTIDKRKLSKYEKMEISLADDQHDEMCTLIDKISDGTNEDLELVFAEGDSYGVGDKLREVWKTDRRQQMRDFFKDQERNGKYNKICIKILLCVL